MSGERERERERHALLLFPRSGAPALSASHDVVTLPHASKHSDDTLCLVQGQRYYELQGCAPYKYASLFLRNRVSSAQQILVASTFDVRFSLLPLLVAAKDKYSPLAQVLFPLAQSGGDERDGGQRLFKDVVSSPAKYKLHELCDVNDQLGEDLVLFRYSQDKTLRWLRDKVARVAKVLAKVRHRRALKFGASSATMASSFCAPDMADKPQATPTDELEGNSMKPQPDFLPKYKSSDSLTYTVSEHDTTTAIEIVCDCLDEAHSELLNKSYGVANTTAAPEQQSGQKRDWQNAHEIEQETAILFSKGVTATNQPPTASKPTSQAAKKQAAAQNKVSSSVIC